MPINLLRFFVLWPIVQAVFFVGFLGAPWALLEMRRLEVLELYYWLPTMLFRNETRFLPAYHGHPRTSEEFALVLGFYAIVAFGLSVLTALAFSWKTRLGNMPPDR